jgi:hypothetical protein
MSAEEKMEAGRVQDISTRPSPTDAKDTSAESGLPPSCVPQQLPPTTFARTGTAYLGRYNEQVANGQGDAHRAQALATAKERLPRPVAAEVIEHATAEPGVNPYAVISLDLSIQRAFRIKLLTLLVLQVGYSLGLGLLIRFVPPIMELVMIAFPAQSWQSYLLFLFVAITLPMLTCIKNKHPWNLVSVFLWSNLLGLFIGISDFPGSFFRSHALVVIMGEAFLGILLTLFFCQLRSKDEFGDPSLVSFKNAGTLSYLIWLPVAIVVFTQMPEGESTVGHLVGATLVATLVHVWVCYDSYKLCCKLSPDEYLSGVLSFYTDMFYVCCCCAILACMGGGGGGAPPKTAAR